MRILVPKGKKKKKGCSPILSCIHPLYHSQETVDQAEWDDF